MLYRFFASDGRLLYVGSTYQPGRRWVDHEGKCWFAEVATATVEHFEDVAAMRVAEARIIKTEAPLLNVVDQARPPRDRAVRRKRPGALYLEGHDYLAEAAALHHRASVDALAEGEERRRKRDLAIRRLRDEDPRRWTYPELADAVGCSPELIAYVIKAAQPV